MTTLDRKLFAAFQDQFAFSTQPRGLSVWVNRKAFLSYPKARGDARPPPPALFPGSRVEQTAQRVRSQRVGSRVAQSSALHLSK